MSTSVTQIPGLRFINAGDARPEIPLIYNPTTGDYDLATSSDGLLNIANFVWNTGTLSWDKMTQPGGGGGGGGAVTIADGADIVEGTLADAAVITDAAGTVSGKLRGLVKWAYERMPTSLGQKAMAASFPVVIASDQSAVPVSGSLGRSWDLNFAADQVDVSGSTIGAVVTGTVTIIDGGGSITIDGAVSVSNFPAVQPINDNGGSLTVDGTVAISGTVPVSIAATVTVDEPVVDLVGNAPATASVGVASATALAANGNRKGAVFVNLSVNTISFGLDGGAAVLNNGITLTPFGTWVMDDYTFTTGEIRAIASAAASTLSIQEFQ